MTRSSRTEIEHLLRRVRVHSAKTEATETRPSDARGRDVSRLYRTPRVWL